MFSKRFPPLVVALAALNAGFAQALGLGEITLHSQLDQPLSAEIRLRGMGDLDPDQIIVRLAPAADFERSGVDRLYSLTEMRFDVRSGISGEGVVQIRTEQPVREPYLDFLIEVRWPSGRVLREYTVLLDLPTYSAEPPPAVRAPNVAAPTRSARAARANAGGTWSGGSSYDVNSGDTLWSIASRTRPSGVSVQQMLNALHRDNPEAFVNGDIDRLRAGVVLRVPADPSAVTAAADAGGADTQAPQLAKELPPPSIDVAEASGGAPATPDDQAYLRLAGDKTPSGASATGGEPGGTGGSSAGQGDIAAVQENLSAKERENAELASRVKALEEQVQNYQRVVDLKSDAMAAAQTGAAAPESPAAGAASPASAPNPPVVPAPEAGVLDMLLANSVALGATLGALFLGVLGFLVLRRRGETATYGALPDTQQRYRTADRKSEPEVPAPREPTVPPAMPASTGPVSSQPAAVFPASVVAPVATTSTVGLAVSPEQDQRERELNDPIGEADIYIAYGRHERAIEVLRLALEGDVERSDLRLKLLEVLAERGDQVAFIAEYDQLLALGEDDDVAAGREIAIGTGHPHWLAELDAPPGIQSALAPKSLSPAPSLSRALRVDEPGADLASLDLEEQGVPPVGEFDLDLDLDLDLGGDLDAGDHEVVDEDELASGFGDLDIGVLDISPETAAEALPSVADTAAVMVGVEPAAVDISAGVFDAAGPDADDFLAPSPPAADTEEEAADFDLLEGTDEVETRIELAKAFIDMGDVEGARDILDEVAAEGSQVQRETAMALLDTLKPA